MATYPDHPPARRRGAGRPAPTPSRSTPGRPRQLTAAALTAAALTAAALTAAALTVAALAGCGATPAGSGVAAKPAAQILAAARSAAYGAATVHVAGSILGAGKPISIDMELVADKGGQGRLTFGDLQIDLVDLDGEVYASGNSAFYERFLGAGARALIGEDWLRQASARGPLRALEPFADLRQLVGIALAGHGALSRGRQTRVDGRCAIEVVDDSDGGSLYVASTGTPYPLELVQPRAAGRLVFDRWNQPATIEAPAHVIDVDRLERGR